MEWLTSIRTAIDYIEEHLTESISAQDVANQVYLSPFFLQKGFSLMTGYGIGEYIRNRRLYLAALDLKDTNDKVIDIAFRYGSISIPPNQNKEMGKCLVSMITR